MPTVLPVSSRPMSLAFSHSPRRVVSSARTTWRRSARMSATTSSATAFELAPGVFMTSMPFERAYLPSMLSKPAPARTTALSCGRASITSAVTFSERTMSAWASGWALARSRMGVLGSWTTS